MSTFDKIKSKILSTPTVNDLTAKEIQHFLTTYGFILKRVKGSHFIYFFPSKNRNIMLNIPMHSPVKPYYIDQIRECILEIEGD